MTEADDDAYARFRDSASEDWPPVLLAGFLLAIAVRHEAMPPGPPGTVKPAFVGKVLRAAALRIDKPETAIPSPWKAGKRELMKFARNAQPKNWPNDLLSAMLMKMAVQGEANADTDVLILRSYREAAIRLDAPVAIRSSRS